MAYLNQQIPKSLYQAAIILTDSEFSRQEIVDAFPEVESRIRVVYPGINPSVANAGADTDLVQWLGTDPPPYFLFLATLEPRKNISRLLEAYATLPDRFRNEHPLYLAGNFGWREAEFSDVLKRLRVGRPGFSALFPTPSFQPFIAVPWRWSTHPSTKVSACPPSRPWQLGARCWSAT